MIGSQKFFWIGTVPYIHNLRTSDIKNKITFISNGQKSSLNFDWRLYRRLTLPYVRMYGTYCTQKLNTVNNNIINLQHATASKIRDEFYAAGLFRNFVISKEESQLIFLIEL